MTVTDTRALVTYSAFSRAVHWLTLVLMASQFLLVWLADLFDKPIEREMVAIHRSFGIVILALTVVRIIYRLTVGTPVLDTKLPRLQELVSKAVQGALIVLLIAEPMTAWTFTNMGGRAVAVFGVDLPILFDADPVLRKTFRGLHGLIADALLVLIGLHAAAALWHHYVLKDNILRSMLGR